jgi:hypothetical protein
MRWPYILPIAHINRLKFTASYKLSASDYVDFFLDFRHPIRSTNIRQYNPHNDYDGIDLFIIDMAKVFLNKI